MYKTDLCKIGRQGRRKMLCPLYLDLQKISDWGGGRERFVRIFTFGVQFQRNDYDWHKIESVIFCNISGRAIFHTSSFTSNVPMCPFVRDNAVVFLFEF